MSGIERSIWIIHYDASSCNGCDIEVLACLTPVYDAERVGARAIGGAGGHWGGERQRDQRGFETSHQQSSRRRNGRAYPTPRLALSMGYSPDIHANPPDFIVWMARAVQDGNSAFLQAIVLQTAAVKQERVFDTLAEGVDAGGAHAHAVTREHASDRV